jgi:biotin transporter BioY
LVAFSLLFTVVTWYRKDEIPSAAFLLALATTLGFVLGVGITFLLVLPHTAGAALLGFGVLFFLPIDILVLVLIFAVLVATGRRLRRFFAPETLDDAAAPGGGGH